MNTKFNHLSCLYNYNILDTPKEKPFDDITFLAANIFNMPFALISFIDSNRQWNKSCFGVNICEVSLNDSFCVHTLDSREILEIEDASVHPLFKNNVSVLKEPFIRFYAGVPLVSPEGFQIGALCVFDNKPYKLSESQKQILKGLANQVISQLELKKNIADLDKAKNQLDEAQDIAKIGHWEWNLLSNELTWSKNQYKLFGYTDDLPYSISYELFLSHLEPEEQAITQASVQQALLERKGFLREHEVLTKQGQKRIFLETGRIEFKDNVAVRMYGTTQDITEVRNLQVQLNQQQKALVESSKMALMGQMAGGIAHEINNPLAVLVAHLGLQLEDDSCSESLKKSLNKMMNICQNIAEIVKGLRMISQTETSGPKQYHSVNSIITKVISLYGEKFKKNNIEFQVNLSQDTSILCSEVEFSQVLFNLLNNSIDAVAKQPKAWIKLSTQVIDEMVEVGVTDSGTPIKEEMKDKLFTPFFTTKEVGHGMGLGLSISYGIIKDHMGSLFLDDKAVNTCFCIKMPCK